MEIKSNQRAINRMALVCLCMSIITLNVNGLNSPFKKYRTVGWIKKKDLTIHCLQEIHFRFKNTCRFKF